MADEKIPDSKQRKAVEDEKDLFEGDEVTRLGVTFAEVYSTSEINSKEKVRQQRIRFGLRSNSVVTRKRNRCEQKHHGTSSSSSSDTEQDEIHELYILDREELDYTANDLSAVEASGKLDFGELELELWDSRYMLRGYKEENKWTGWCKPSCIPISIILVLIILVVVLSLVDQNHIENANREQMQLQKDWLLCRNNCRIELVESIPEGLTFNSSVTHSSTHDGWAKLLDLAEEKIEIGSFYWNLLDEQFAPELSAQGRDIYERLLEAGTTRGISIKIAQSLPTPAFPNTDTASLVKENAAEVRSLNFTRLLGAGVLHTKMWIVDRKHVYIGSANFDWKSLTQVKELGILVTNCTCLAKDLGKIFDVYWELGKEGAKIPEKWPASFATLYNKENPMNIAFNGVKYSSYLSSSPPPFCPNGRTGDLDAIKDVIRNATKFIHIAVMDYSPSLLYSKPPKFWPEIDNELRAAALDRGVQVRILVALWDHTKNSTYKFLESLQDLNKIYRNVQIEVKLFKVPATPEQKKIPFARVNHNKYMVTDKSAYIGTSNWSGDYFINTAGVGFISTPQNETAEDTNFRTEVVDIFERDWSSSYSIPLSNFLPDHLEEDSVNNDIQ